VDENTLKSLPPEQQIAFLKEQLLQTQRYTALGELVGTTTHEFNNVLTTIINWARHGLRHRDDATRDKAFDAILAAATRGSRITQTILGMARRRSNTMEPTDLRQLLADTLLLLEREMNKYHIRVEVAMEEVPPVMANPGQIQQVLLNLLTNARQAMPRGGRLVIRLHHDPGSEFVDLQIRDYGTGIPPEILPKIFDPFFTTKTGPDASGKGGTGLGLSACKEIIEAHRGRIRVESAVGKGTCFTIRLPCAAVATSSPSSNPNETTQPTAFRSQSVPAAPTFARLVNGEVSPEPLPTGHEGPLDNVSS